MLTVALAATLLSTAPMGARASTRPGAAGGAPHGIIVRTSPSSPLEYLPDSVLEKSGFTVDHPLRTIYYSDGGYATVFRTSSGTEVTLPVPPNGFDPTTASPVALIRYGFTPRPADPAALAAWLASISADRVTEPTLKLLELPKGTNNSSNWAGYQQNGPSAHYYRFISGDYQETNVLGACPQEASVSSWVGLAGGGYPFNQSDIEQTGTYSDVNPNGINLYHEIWWEDWPTNAILLAGTTVNAGDTIEAAITDLQYLGAQAFDWSVTDKTTGLFRNGTQPLTSAYSTQQLAWVTERVSVGNTPTNLLPHSTIPWSSTLESWANGSANAYNVGSQDIEMFGQYGALEYDSQALTSGGSFATSWNGYCS